MKETTKYPITILEEELKNRVAADWFAAFDSTRILSKIDFCVSAKSGGNAEFESLLWAEAKKGVKADIYASFVQLILTIGRERTAEKHLPPKFLGAFDAASIAFLPYTDVMDVFSQNDFNWNVAPSDHESKEFRQLYDRVKAKIEGGMLRFDFLKDESELRRFIRSNFSASSDGGARIRITKNNFTHIYRKWREAVMPLIAAPWDVLKSKYAIYDRDFYLAELNIDDNGTADIADDRVAGAFYIEFDAKSSTPYIIKRKNEDDLFCNISFGFKPGGLEAYAAFWRRYSRPPKKEYWDFIVSRLDLLVPQDVRERKGSFFTPAIWVELSQEYLRRELGDDWQDEYYIWDCCAGTGNLLAGLTNKYRIWASTLDQQDVDVMHERIKNGSNLLDSHVFQFDFLNDSFDKLPADLKRIIDDPEERKRLVIYINPPYAEAGDIKQRSGTGQNKTNVAVVHGTYRKYLDKIGIAGRELFAQFFMRIHDEIPGCILAEFSKLKHLQSPNFKQFRQAFKAFLGISFIVPADTFDNVKGSFPIGFFVWRLDAGFNAFASTVSDVYDRKGEFFGTKTIVSYDDDENIGKWIATFRDNDGMRMGFQSNGRNDFQNQNLVYFMNDKSQMPTPRGWWITPFNLIPMCIFVAVRHCIEATWINDRDTFLYPNDGWKNDLEFQADCLVYSLFSGQNRISGKDGANHWIPFTEAEVNAQGCFASHFMSDYLAGKIAVAARPESSPYHGDLFNPEMQSSTHPQSSCGSCGSWLTKPPCENLTTTARAVLDAGRELWRYYHAQPGANPNASFYDIRLHFQGVKTLPSGKTQMNADSSDEMYTRLLASLRAAHRALAAQIAPKVYDYGFLRK